MAIAPTRPTIPQTSPAMAKPLSGRPSLFDFLIPMALKTIPRGPRTTPSRNRLTTPQTKPATAIPLPFSLPAAAALRACFLCWRFNAFTASRSRNVSLRPSSASRSARVGTTVSVIAGGGAATAAATSVEILSARNRENRIIRIMIRVWVSVNR